MEGPPGDGSAVGGINDQIASGTGILLPDPTDLPAFGAPCAPCCRIRNGGPGWVPRRAHVRDNFVGDLHLLRYAEAFAALTAGAGGPPAGRRLA